MMHTFLFRAQSMMQSLSIFIGMIFCFAFHSSAQNLTNEQRLQQLTDKGVQIHPDQCVMLNEQDFFLLASFDFNPYRNEKTVRQVQIKKGPAITIQSIQWMVEHQQTVDPSIVNKKQGEVLSSSTISTITLIDIGAGFKTLEKSEKWITE